MREDTKKYSWKKLVTSLLKADEAIEELEGAKAALKTEMDERLKEEGLNSKHVDGYGISSVEMVRFTTKVEEARELGATENSKSDVEMILRRHGVSPTDALLDELMMKVTEKVNTGRLRSLHDSGVSVPGVNVIKYIKIQKI